MDPNATFEMILDALDSGDWSDLQEAFQNLYDWLHGGGFPPSIDPMKIGKWPNGNQRTNILSHKLSDKPKQSFAIQWIDVADHTVGVEFIVYDRTGELVERFICSDSKCIVEISTCGSVSVCDLYGNEPNGKLLENLQHCGAGGDCEPACRYFLDTYKPQFRIVKKIDGEYENVIADENDKQLICQTIYFESETDFSDVDNSELYLMWQAGSDLK